MEAYALELKNITKMYQDGEQVATVLKDVSIRVKKGEFVAIVGPSGSGKSTFLSIAGALLAPTTGEVVIGGKVVPKKQKEWTKIRQQQIGFIFQSHQLIPYLKVREQLELIRIIGGNKSVESVAYASELLADLGLNERLEYYPNKLSGGEKQRVAIARAFMNQPDIILADEPTASLDGFRGRQVVERIQVETKRYNKSAVMVTHDERVLDLVDTVYKIENGILTYIRSGKESLCTDK